MTPRRSPRLVPAPTPVASSIWSPADSPAHKRKITSEFGSPVTTKKALVTARGLVTPDSTSFTAADSIPLSPSSFDNQEFQDLNVPPSELRPSATLTTGQCFHWKALLSSDDLQGSNTNKSAWGTHNATDWIGTLRDSVSGTSIVVAIRETPETTLFRVVSAPVDFDVRSFLISYFQLAEASMEELYATWSKKCSRLRAIAHHIPGVRIVDQDPFECLISFICSSNNNIPRITKMLAALRQEYGEPLVRFGGDTLYSFPSAETLRSRATDDDLRNKCGLGYRAKYILETLQTLESLGGESYLQELRAINDPDLVQEKLLQFCGVGRKVRWTFSCSHVPHH